MLNILQRNQINLILFSGRVSTGEAGHACFAFSKFKLQINDETGTIVFAKKTTLEMSYSCMRNTFLSSLKFDSNSSLKCFDDMQLFIGAT